MLSFLGFSVFLIQMRSWALWASKGKLRIMYVFLPVHIFRSFDASFAENIAMLNVYFFIDSPSVMSPVAADLFSEATPAQQSWRYRSMYSLVFPLVPLVVPVFFFPSNFVLPKRIWSKTCSWWLLRPSLSLPDELDGKDEISSELPCPMSSFFSEDSMVALLVMHQTIRANTESCRT